MKTEPIHPHIQALGKDESGTIRIGGTRVTLETVVSAYEQGATPEGIVSQYDVLTLPQVYETISYYLNHREEVEAYLEAGRKKAEEVRRTLEEAGVTPSGAELVAIRERLERRMRQADARAAKS